MIFSVKIRYFIFLEDSNKTCDSSNTSASSQPNQENCSSSELTPPQSDPAKAADDPDIGERDAHTPVSVHEEIGKRLSAIQGDGFSFFSFFLQTFSIFLNSSSVDWEELVFCFVFLFF